MSGQLSHRRALRRIERELARSDPHLNALFLSVAALDRGKGMPEAEMIRSRAGWLPTRLGGRAGRHRTGEDGRRPARRTPRLSPLARRNGEYLNSPGVRDRLAGLKDQ